MFVQIYSREKIEQLIAKESFPQNTAVISICDRGTLPRDRVDYSSVCNCVMYVELDDVDFEDVDDYDTFFPESQEVAEFVVDAFANGMNIICQCEYGQSRSAGCAAAIMEYFFRTGIDVFKDYRYYPNKVVYNKVFDALHTLEKH